MDGKEVKQEKSELQKPAKARTVKECAQLCFYIESCVGVEFSSECVLYEAVRQWSTDEEDSVILLGNTKVLQVYVICTPYCQLSPHCN